MKANDSYYDRYTLDDQAQLREIVTGLKHYLEDEQRLGCEG